jgi:hypothetical protein
MCCKGIQSFGTGAVARLLELVIDEAESEDERIAGEYFKFGATAALVGAAMENLKKIKCAKNAFGHNEKL